MHRVIIEKVKIGCGDWTMAIPLYSERVMLKMKYAPIPVSPILGDIVIFTFNIFLCLGFWDELLPSHFKFKFPGLLSQVHLRSSSVILTKEGHCDFSPLQDLDLIKENIYSNYLCQTDQMMRNGFKFPRTTVAHQTLSSVQLFIDYTKYFGLDY